MLAAAEIARSGGGGAASSPRAAGPSVPALGPAMRIMLALAWARSRRRTDGGGAVEALWELAERYHPEQAWLAASWACGDRTLEEIERRASPEALAPALRQVFGRFSPPAQDLRGQRAFAQE